MTLLEWNENANKVMVACKKVFMHHFVQNFSIDPFLEMEPDLLASILDFIHKDSAENIGEQQNVAQAADRACLPILYKLVQSNVNGILS